MRTGSPSGVLLSLWLRSKRIAYIRIQGIKSRPMSWATGKGRLWGAADPRYWFPLDIHRGSKKTLLVLDVGRGRVQAVHNPREPRARH